MNEKNCNSSKQHPCRSNPRLPERMSGSMRLNVALAIVAAFVIGAGVAYIVQSRQASGRLTTASQSPADSQTTRTVAAPSSAMSSPVTLTETAQTVSTTSGPVPKYKDYPAPPIYNGPAAALVVDDDFTRQYYARLTSALSERPDFAGEYVMTGWSCGTGGCVVSTLINKRTGKILGGQFMAYNASSGDMPDGKEERIGETPETLRIDSRLLVTREVTDDESPGKRLYFANFYVLENDELKRIRRVPIPPDPDYVE